MTLSRAILTVLLLMFATDAMSQRGYERAPSFERRPDIRTDRPDFSKPDLDQPTLVVPSPPPPLQLEPEGCVKHWECDDDCRRAEGTNYCPAHCKKLAC